MNGWARTNMLLREGSISKVIGRLTKQVSESVQE